MADEPGTYPDYVRSWATPAGVILIELRGRRLRVTDYLPGGIENTYRLEPDAECSHVVGEFCHLNRWGEPRECV